MKKPLRKKTYPQTKWTSQAILNAIRRWAWLHDGRPPRSEEWEKPNDGWYPYSATVRHAFGTWNNALQMAGLPINRPQSAERIYSDEDLLSSLRACPHQPPSVTYWKKNGLHPTHAIFVQRFGSWNQALIKAGIKPRAARRTYVADTVK